MYIDTGNPSVLVCVGITICFVSSSGFNSTVSARNSLSAPRVPLPLILIRSERGASFL